MDRLAAIDDDHNMTSLCQHQRDDRAADAGADDGNIVLLPFKNGAVPDSDVWTVGPERAPAAQILAAGWLAVAIHHSHHLVFPPVVPSNGEWLLHDAVAHRALTIRS